MYLATLQFSSRVQLVLVKSNVYNLTEFRQLSFDCDSLFIEAILLRRSLRPL